MADFYSLIARGVLSLSHNTAEARQKLYERARSVLTDQLLGASELDRARQRLALEMVIKRVEDENTPANQHAHTVA
jgi:hypothetical protein